MSKFFDFYDPLDKRYLFNSFLVVVGLVEILILVITLVWQVDEGIFGDQVRVVPFPWKEYLVAAFTAPIVLLFLFGLIIQGFERFGPVEETPGTDGPGRRGFTARLGRSRYLLGLAALIVLVVLIVNGQAVFALLTALVKALGLGGSYLLLALLALGLLYLPLRLFLRYRLEKQGLEYRYLLTLAQRHGLLLVDPRTHPELAAQLAPEKNSAPAAGALPAPPAGEGESAPQ